MYWRRSCSIKDSRSPSFQRLPCKAVRASHVDRDIEIIVCYRRLQRGCLIRRIRCLAGSAAYMQSKERKAKAENHVARREAQIPGWLVRCIRCGSSIRAGMIKGGLSQWDRGTLRLPGRLSVRLTGRACLSQTLISFCRRNQDVAL